MRTHTLHKQAPLMQMIQEPSKEPSHTPGPWEVKNKVRPMGKKGPLFIGSMQGGRINIICELGQNLSRENQANSKLIASAPIMLEALQAIVDALGDQDSLLIEQAKDAIRKATQ